MKKVLGLTIVLTMGWTLGGRVKAASNDNHQGLVNQNSSGRQEAQNSAAISSNLNLLCQQGLMLETLKAFKKSVEAQNTSNANIALVNYFEKSGILPKKPFFFGSKIRNKNLSALHFQRSKDVDFFQLKLQDGSYLDIQLKNSPQVAISTIMHNPIKGSKHKLCENLIPSVNTQALQTPFEKKAKASKQSKGPASRFVDYLMGKFNVSGSNASRSWNPTHFRTAASVADKHPRLLGLTNENLFGNLCSNFLSMDIYQRKAVIAKTVMALAWAESQFNRNDKGDERRASEKSMGVFQLSGNVRKNYGCSGTLTSVGSSSIDCVYRIFEKWGVSNSKTFWSVLRPNYVTKWNRKTIYHPMERRFMPTFKAYVPECKTSITPQPGHRDSKAPPSFDLVGEGLFNYVDQRS